MIRADVRRLAAFAVHVDGEAGVVGEERLLPFGVAAVGAVGVRVEELAQGEPVGGFSRNGLRVDSHRWELLRVILRSEAGRDSYDRGLSDLVGELSTQSEAFRTRSAAHNVRLHQTGAKHVHHPVVGDLSLTFEMMELRADTGLTILTYIAEPGSKSEEALDLLGSWAATLDQAEPANVSDR